MSEQTRDDGGQAFTGKKLARRWSDAEGTTVYETIPSAGMSLRDYFAAKAMQAIVSRAGYAYGSDQAQCASDIADNAFVLADAMLEARK